MDWDFAIERHRVPLLCLVAELFAEMGLTEGGTVERVSKPVYRYALRLLRKAESAVRRLIYVAARNIVIEPSPKRPPRAERKSSEIKAKVDNEGKPKHKRKRRWSFRLFDPPKRENRAYGRPPKPRQAEPRVHFFGYDPRIPLFLRSPAPAPAPVVEQEVIVDDGMVDATKLIRRFMALTDALQDIPRHAMRLARWRASPVEERHPPRSSPLRSGRALGPAAGLPGAGKARGRRNPKGMPLARPQCRAAA